MSQPLAKPFTAAAKPAKRKPKRRRPSSLSIRVSDEERAILKRKAGKRSLGAYVRHVVLGDEQEPRKKVAPQPKLDAELLGRVLGRLGTSDQVSCLFLLLAAAEAERVAMADEDRAAIRAACADVREMRVLLLKALGLRGDGS